MANRERSESFAGQYEEAAADPARARLIIQEWQ
jgi:hypothetical protein